LTDFEYILTANIIKIRSQLLVF